MQCPYCNIEINEDWLELTAFDKDDWEHSKPIKLIDGDAELSLLWMRCPHKQCRHLIVQGLITQRTNTGINFIAHFETFDQWIILPRRTNSLSIPVRP